MSNLGPVRNLKDLHTFEAGSEVITEIFGSAVGGTKQHSVAKIRIKKGGKSRDHYHPVAEESYIILEGKGKMVLNGEERLIGPGDNVAIVATTRHQKLTNQIFNAGDEDLVFYAICSPPWTPDCSVFLD